MGENWSVWMAGAAAALAVTTTAAAAHEAGRASAPAGPEPVFYDISEDPQALKLLALSDSGRRGPYTLLDIIDVTRSPDTLTTNTWRIDCGAERMAIIHTVQVQPGSPVQQTDIKADPISIRASPTAFRAAQLACSGKGVLAKRRTYRGELITIVKRFWAGQRL